MNMLNINHPSTQAFNSMIGSLHLKQVVTEPTRYGDGTATLIDVLCVSDSLSIENVACMEISDHCSISCEINASVPKGHPTPFTYRIFRFFRLNYTRTFRIKLIE